MAIINKNRKLDYSQGVSKFSSVLFYLNCLITQYNRSSMDVKDKYINKAAKIDYNNSYSQNEDSLYYMKF